MKYPTARKLPSGSWTCRVRIKGKDISITRPDKKTAIAEAMALKAGIKTENRQEVMTRRLKTVGQALDEYISSRENVLSPSTIRGYRVYQRNRFKSAKGLRINDVTGAKWQQIVNAEAQLCSEKTLRNSWRLLSAAIYEETGVRIAVRLPQVVEKDLPFLTPEQIPIFVDAIRGDPIEIPALLALSSMRRSEILALRWEDVDLVQQTILIAGAAVVGPDGKLKQKKSNKNKNSRRIIPVIPPLQEALCRTPHPDRGLVVTCGPNELWRQINRICRNAGLPEIGVHGLRRSFASLAYHLHLSEEVTMRIGGWSDIYTMRKIYTKISARDIADQSALFTGFFDSENTRIGNENGNEK